MKNRSFDERLSSEIMYLKYDFEDALIKSVPGEGFWVKLSGKPEFKAKDGSKLVLEAVLERKEITKSEYEKA